MIQLSLFFMVATVSLWIDQLMNSGIGDLVTFLTLYKVTSFVTLVVSIYLIFKCSLFTSIYAAFDPLVDDRRSNNASSD